MSGLNLPQDFTGWSISVTHSPNMFLSIGPEDDGDAVDISDSVHHFTWVDRAEKTIEVNVRRFTESTAEHIQEIAAAWTEAPRSVADQIQGIFSRLDFAKVKEALELVEYLLRLLVEYGGPVLRVIQELMKA